MKKGQTESYSFLIGIIIAVLILTAIGCAVYNMYKPQGTDSFNKFASDIKKLEKKGDVEGEYALLLGKNQFVVGFDKYQSSFRYSPDCPTSFWSENQGPIDWGCYGINFLRPREAVTTIAIPSWELANIAGRPKEIRRPENCPKGKSCLCLCEIDQLLRDPFIISEQACFKSSAKCVSLESIELVGGEGCCEGVFIPGIKLAGGGQRERGLKVVNYKKIGTILSLDDEKALIGEELLEALKEKEEGKKQEVIEGEQQKIAKLEEQLKTDKKKIYFIPVNWDKSKEEFDSAVNSHFAYIDQKIKELEEEFNAPVVERLSDSFDVVNMGEYKQCSIDLSLPMSDKRNILLDCLSKADPSLTKETLKRARYIGLTDDEGFCGATDLIDTIIAKYNDPSHTAHEWGHLLNFCDEYKYTEWKDLNDHFKEVDLGCVNPYPLCCADHPYWKENKEYLSYLEEEKLGYNCYPHYDSLSSEAKNNYKTREEYETFLEKSPYCQGHICEPKIRKKHCRGLMGPEISCKNLNQIYGDSIEYSFIDFYRPEDYALREQMDL